MGRCSGCSGDRCSCVVRGGSGARVTGTGTQANPYVIETDAGGGGGGGSTGLLPGMIMGFGGSVAPAGWLISNGAAVSRTAYAALFAAIGIVYGAGDGSTTFNLPDLAGRFPLGSDGTHPLGDQTQGAESTALTVNHIPQHAHTIAHTHDIGHGHTAGSGPADTNHYHNYNTGYSGGHSHTVVVGQAAAVAAGGGGTVIDDSYVIQGTGGDGGHSHSGTTAWASDTNGNQSHSHSVTVNNFAGNSGASSAANSGNYGTASPTAVPTMPPWTGITYLIKT